MNNDKKLKETIEDDASPIDYNRKWAEDF